MPDKGAAMKEVWEHNNVPLKAGDVLIIETGGGGGYGDPGLRAPAAIARDRRDGYVLPVMAPATQ